MNENFGPSSSDLSGASTYTMTQAGLVSQNPEEQDNPALDSEQNKYFDFGTAKIHLTRIIEDWHTEVEDTEVRRKTRDVEIDTEGLRQKGDLDEDETIIPVRVIDTNIQRELPSYINYLKNSRRICTFRSLSNPNQDTQNIETAFTQGMTYTAWEIPHYKEIDGAAAHGWAAVEVVYDESKPLHVGIEYVAHDKLFWPRSVENIQDAPHILRCYDVTIPKLREWVRTFGFDPVQVDKLAASRKETTKESETVRIYKHFFKKENIVYVSWFATTDGLDDWLKAPVKHFVGIMDKQQQMIPQDVPAGVNPNTGEIIMTQQMIPQESWVDAELKQYPVFRLPYRETEKPKAVDAKGRCFMDEAKQESQTAILSGFVNGITRASNVYSSPAQEDGTGSSLREIEDVKLCGGRILSKPMIFWSTPYPDPMIIRALQYFDSANSEETNQVNFASLNREDSRKTAKEIGAAQQQQTLLNSVQLTLYSTHIREVYSFTWLIVQSQALQGQIAFLQIQNPQTQQWTNDIATISQVYELRAAGDVDVIQRQEKIQQMKQDWPVIANTPLALRFLADLIKLEYPDTGEQYAKILEQGNPANLAAALGTIIEGIFHQHPEVIKTINPQEQEQLGQLLIQAKQLVPPQQNQNTQNGSAKPNQPQRQPSPANNGRG